MATKLGPRYPIGTHCIHMSHGRGRIIGYNGQSKIDLDKQLKMVMDIQREQEMNTATSDALYAIYSRCLSRMIYDNERYPYVIKYEPTEKYPEGFQEVYGPENMKFSANGESWCAINHRGEVEFGHQVHLDLMKESNNHLMQRGRWRRKYAY